MNKEKKKEKEFLVHQEEVLRLALSKAEAGSEEYTILWNQYVAIANTLHDLEKNNVPWLDIVDKVVTACGVVIAGIGTIVVPMELAKMAYTNEEEDARLPNGRIWNLIPKNSFRNSKN